VTRVVGAGAPLGEHGSPVTGVLRDMQTTVVMNAKGGVGKTTIATNLASYFVANAVPTTIMDYDPQGSSLRWLKLRPPTAAPIHGANAAPRTGTALKSLERYVPPTTKQLILDAPAGPSRLLLKDLLDKAGSILIPVAPSAIDIHATANFIKDLLLVGGVRHLNIRIAVIANRVRSSGTVYEPLERFVSSLRLTFLSRIRDSEIYIEAGDTGSGIFEMDPHKSADQRREFVPIVEWLTGESLAHNSRTDNVVPFASRA
jgi:chromosome partitioning protein